MKNEVEKRGKQKTVEKKNFLFWISTIPNIGSVVSPFLEKKPLFAISFTVCLCMLAFLVFLFVFNTYFDFMGYKKRKKRLMYQCEKNDVNYIILRERLKENCWKRYFENVFKKIWKILCIVIVSIVVTYSNNMDYVEAYFDGLKAWILDENKKDLVSSDKPTLEEDDYDEEKENEGEKDSDINLGASEGQEPERKNSKWSFILDNPSREEFDDFEDIEQVFFYYSDTNDIDENYVLKFIDAIYSENRAGVDYTEIQDSAGNNFYTYTDCEDKFKDKVDMYKYKPYYNEWLDHAPHSSELDDIIRGRERLNEVAVDGEKGCFELWKHLANDYQYYAEEYTEQTNNKKAIRHYYMKCIYCCMQGLKYSMREQERIDLYHYMVMRYQDMADERAKIPTKDKQIAAKIHSILEERDVLDE